MTIVEFLTARYDEREAVARAAVGSAAFQKQTGRWSLEKVPNKYGSVPIVFALADGGAKTQAANLSMAWESDERGAHIAANDPAYVLADIAAKRAILSEHSRTLANNSDETPVGDEAPKHGWVCDTCCDWSELDLQYVGEWPCRTVKVLAVPFAGHPDYDEAWCP